MTEHMTLPAALRSIKRDLGIAVLVGLCEKPYGQGWANQALARLEASEQLALINEAVAAIDKPLVEITIGDIHRELARLLLVRAF